MNLDDERARPAARGHEIGADLSALSIAELDARVELLAAEIERLRAEKRRKQNSHDAALSFFRPAGSGPA